MKRLYSEYRGEEMVVLFSAQAELNDFGVPRSPVWEEIDESTIHVESLEILGVEVPFKSLPLTLQCEILNLADTDNFN